MTKKIKEKKQISPIIMLVILIVIASFSSLILSVLNVDSTQTAIMNGTLETSIVVVKNIFSQEGLIYFFSNIIVNFNLVEPFALLIISLMALGLAKSSGLLDHLVLPLKKLNPNILTFIIVFISVISTIVGDYSYIILFPLVAIIYQQVNKSPVLGILTVFLGITLGYGTNLLYNYDDYALGMLTQAAATADVDATYKYNLLSNIYIMITSTIAISFLITFLINKHLFKKFTALEEKLEQRLISRKALILSIISIIIVVVFIGSLCLPNGILLDNIQNLYVAKLLSSMSPFYMAFMFLFLLVISIASIVYGFISKNYKNNHELSWGLTKEFNNLGYLFTMMFLSSILISIIDWTNIGVVVANNLIYIISLFDFTGIPLIIISFILIIVMSILMPNNLEKWTLISPVLVPLFMRDNLTPDFAQFVFKVADSVGKVISPLFIYFIIMVGFIQKYNEKENKITLFNTLKLIWPIIIIVIIFWLLLLIIWYIAGLPLGIDTLATM